MPFINSLKEMDKKFSWSFLGFLLAVIFGAITIYLGFIKVSNPDLKYIVTSNFGVLDIKENLGSLDVLYEGGSLSKNNKDLRIITFQVINQGDTAILPNFYDPNDPVGFSIAGGVVADAPILLRSTNSYLSEKLLLSKVSDKTVLFSNVILEPGDFFEVKVLVLHDAAKKPSIQPVGKVAGVANISVLESYEPSDSRSLLQETFGGGFYANGIRIIAHGFIFFATVISIMLITEKVSDIKEGLRKKRLIAAFKDFDSNRVSEKDEYFFNCYLLDGARAVRRVLGLMQVKKRLEFIDRVGMLDEDSDEGKNKRARYRAECEILFNLKTHQIVVSDGEGISVEHDRLEVLSDFINYLSRKGEFKRIEIITVPASSAGFAG